MTSHWPHCPMLRTIIHTIVGLICNVRMYIYNLPTAFLVCALRIAHYDSLKLLYINYVLHSNSACNFSIISRLLLVAADNYIFFIYLANLCAARARFDAFHSKRLQRMFEPRRRWLDRNCRITFLDVFPIISGTMKCGEH